MTKDYTSLLHRAPDAAGLDVWVKMLEHGAVPEQVDAGLATSPEYFALHGSTAAGWLDGLYHDFLGRNPDPGGLTVWENQLAANVSPNSVALGFTESPERYANAIAADYQQFLGRAVDPQAAQAW